MHVVQDDPPSGQSHLNVAGEQDAELGPHITTAVTMSRPHAGYTVEAKIPLSELPARR